MAFNNISRVTENDTLVQLFQQSNQEALQKNEENLLNWVKSKEDHATVMSLLQTLPNNLSQDVMVPIGSKALMRGKIVHTNEILVCLGAGWFVKQSAKLASEICNRRITSCDEMLANLERERNLLSSRKQLQLDQEMFGDEIREPYVEEEEQKWRVHHRQKQRDYRQQLKKQSTGTEENISKNDDEMWKKLELLELQEELQGELDMFHAEQTLDENNSQNLQEPWQNSETINSTDTCSEELKHQDYKDVPKTFKRRVSFVEESSTTRSSDTDDDDSDSSGEPLCIQFSHSSLLGPLPRQTNASDGQIQTPADVYNLVPKSAPKSILKRKSLESISTLNNPLRSTDQLQWMPSSEEKYEVDVDVPVAFGDVIEHISEEITPSLPEIPSLQQRPMSRFRAARTSTININSTTNK